jgi:hypothetical protein
LSRQDSLFSPGNLLPGITGSSSSSIDTAYHMIS